MRNIKARFLSLSAWGVPLLFLFVCIASYGLLINQMFFYWDDLPTIWYYQTGGSEIFQKVFAQDRPFLSNLFMLTMPFMKTSAIGWQCFGIFTRWLTGLVFWCLLNILWERRKLENAIFGLLFIIYPGFLQQWIAVTYSHAFIIYAVFLLSLVFMALSLQNSENKKFFLYLVLAVLTQLFTVFCTEYFLGLEILRPFIIAFMMMKDGRQKIEKKFYFAVLKQWLPYLVGMVFFIFWRILIHPFPRNAIQTVNGAASIFPFIVNNLWLLLQNVIESGLFVWGQPFNLISYIDFSLETIWTFFFLFLGVSIAVYLGLRKIFKEPLIVRDTISEESQLSSTLLNQWNFQVLLLALMALIGGILPFRIVNLVIRPVFPYDRFTLPQMVGSSLLVGMGLYCFLKQPRKLILASAGVVAIACLFHYSIALKYVKESELVKDFLWQLSVRAPSFDESTALITSQWPFQFNTDNSLTAPVNWMYSAFPKESMPLMVFDIQARLGKSIPGRKNEETSRIEIEKSAPIKENYRAFEFVGNTSKAVIFSYHPPDCLRLIDPSIDRYLFYPESMYDLIPFSNLSYINKKNDVDSSFLRLLGKRSKKDWCSYYQEAALASQKGEWDQAMQIGHIAFDEHHLQPKQAAELFPFIEGYAHGGNWRKAQDLTIQAYDLSRTSRSGLCALWKRIKQSDVAPKQKIYLEVRQWLSCEIG